jgi:hypothetical protein
VRCSNLISVYDAIIYRRKSNINPYSGRPYESNASLGLRGHAYGALRLLSNLSPQLGEEVSVPQIQVIDEVNSEPLGVRRRPQM